jgi:hypothetical protein
LPEDPRSLAPSAPGPRLGDVRLIILPGGCTSPDPDLVGPVPGTEYVDADGGHGPGKLLSRGRLLVGVTLGLALIAAALVILAL